MTGVTCYWPWRSEMERFWGYESELTCLTEDLVDSCNLVVDDDYGGSSR